MSSKTRTEYCKSTFSYCLLMVTARIAQSSPNAVVCHEPGPQPDNTISWDTASSVWALTFAATKWLHFSRAAVHQRFNPSWSGTSVEPTQRKWFETFGWASLCSLLPCIQSCRRLFPLPSALRFDSSVLSLATMAPNFTDQTSQVLVNGFACVVGFELLYFAFVRFFLEGYFMPRAFRAAYLDLTIVNQRSFTAHVLWLTVKICLLVAAWPFVLVFFCRKGLEDPLFSGTSISSGDILSVAYFAVISMFLFEIIYRLKISPVSLLHHTAGCALGVWQIVEQVMHKDEETESQFRLLILYGVFEVIFETFPHFAVIFYRCQRKDSQGFLKTARVWLYSGLSSLVGTTSELITMAVFMWKNWHYWGLAMRVVIPILHFAFMAAQVHGARIGFQLHAEFKKRAEAARAKELAGPDDDVPANRTSGGTEKEDLVVRVERESSADDQPDNTGLTTTCVCSGPVDKLQLPMYPAV